MLTGTQNLPPYRVQYLLIPRSLCLCAAGRRSPIGRQVPSTCTMTPLTVECRFSARNCHKIRQVSGYLCAYIISYKHRSRCNLRAKFEWQPCFLLCLALAILLLTETPGWFQKLLSRIYISSQKVWCGLINKQPLSDYNNADTRL